MNYKIVFVGGFKENSFTSCDYFSKELSNRFEKLPNVNVQRVDYDSTKFPDGDIGFVHAYTNSNAVKNLSILKSKVKYCVYFMEESWAGFDFCYHYNKIGNIKNGILIDPPIVKEYYSIEEKEPGSILLDHDSSLFPYYNNPNYDWNNFFWSYFEKNKHKYSRIAQLARGNVVRPDFIEVIPLTSHQEYLKNTSKFETYCVTHAGSFNHTAVDMAVRGTRTIVPLTPDRAVYSFVPPYLVEKMDMILFKNEQELTEILDSKVSSKPQIEKAIDLDLLVQNFNHDFETLLRKKGKYKQLLMI